MRIIQKQISLEPMTSRLPSIWPAYLDNRLYFFDDASLSNRSYQYTSNWGMVPVNIVVSPKSVENVLSENINTLDLEVHLINENRSNEKRFLQ